jgi:hypothetical protein
MSVSQLSGPGRGAGGGGEAQHVSRGGRASGQRRHPARARGLGGSGTCCAVLWLPHTSACKMAGRVAARQACGGQQARLPAQPDRAAALGPASPPPALPGTPGQPAPRYACEEPASPGLTHRAGMSAKAWGAATERPSLARRPLRMELATPDTGTAQPPTCQALNPASLLPPSTTCPVSISRASLVPSAPPHPRTATRSRSDRCSAAACAVEGARAEYCTDSQLAGGRRAAAPRLS